VSGHLLQSCTETRAREQTGKIKTSLLQQLVVVVEENRATRDADWKRQNALHVDEEALL
jgi:hypothetical protein